MKQIIKRQLKASTCTPKCPSSCVPPSFEQFRLIQTPCGLSFFFSFHYFCWIWYNTMPLYWRTSHTASFIILCNCQGFFQNIHQCLIHLFMWEEFYILLLHNLICIQKRKYKSFRFGHLGIVKISCHRSHLEGQEMEAEGGKHLKCYCISLLPTYKIFMVITCWVEVHFPVY